MSPGFESQSASAQKTSAQKSSRHQNKSIEAADIKTIQQSLVVRIQV